MSHRLKDYLGLTKEIDVDLIVSQIKSIQLNEQQAMESYQLTKKIMNSAYQFLQVLVLLIIQCNID